jgi:hypothetical protein
MNSSRSSSRKSLKADAPLKVKKAAPLEIKAKNINIIGAQEVNKFKGLFIRDINVSRQNR